MPNKKPLPRQITDTEIDRREWNSKILVLLEDVASHMIKPDGTSEQYIIGIQVVAKKGSIYIDHKRYITDLMVKRGYINAKHGAIAIMQNPEKFKSILGEEWHGYK